MCCVCTVDLHVLCVYSRFACVVCTVGCMRTCCVFGLRTNTL